MKRVVLALCLAAITAAAQAQSSGDHVRKPSRHVSAAAQKPTPVSALLKWLKDKAKANADKTKANSADVSVRRQAVRQHTTRRHAASTPPVPATVPAAPTLASAPAVEPVAPPAPANAPIRPQDVRDRAAPATAAPAAVPAAAATVAAAPAVVPAPPPDPVTATMPRTVATITVTPQLYKTTTRSGGYHSCSTGERIITAYYWEGKHTASGEPFDPDGFTAAHRTFPFGTKLLVVNPRNGKSVTVTVNDRGPFVKGVTLDLSRGAAKAIGMQGTGAVCMAKI
jgi:rare lipoprotein A